MLSETGAQQFIDRFMALTKCQRVEEIEERFGMELADIVYDLKGEERAEVYNGDKAEAARLLKENGFSDEEITGMGDEEQLDLLDQVFTREGEEINNNGIYAQAAYIVATLVYNGDAAQAAEEVAGELGFPARGEPLPKTGKSL